MKPLLLTTGEPAGIGPDICIQLSDYLSQQPVVLCGDIELLRARAQQHGKQTAFYTYRGQLNKHRGVAVDHTPCCVAVEPKCLNVENAPYVLETLRLAAEKTLNKIYSGVVTAPIHKGIICELGTHFSGHTEFFAEQTHADLPVMVLGTKHLKVGLMTTHLPLQEVTQAINVKRIKETLTIIHRDMMRYFTAGRPPSIGICGLNPHAGEGGHMGTEEIEIINPALESLRKAGLNVSNTLPADTLFVPHHAQEYDIIVAMYHDQGLPVIKSQGFGTCVNMTFGLPIIRTSVDHGTALDLAGTAQADCNSLKCAIETALQMAQARSVN